MQQTMSMQDTQYNCQHQSVSDFLHYCYLDQYVEIFLSEGFESVNSLLEITDEDMIFMNVKRGHRRLIQREIANMKGVPRDQPLVTNMMGPNKYLLQGCDAYTVINNRFFVEYAQDLIELKADESTATRRSSSINNHNISGYQMTTTGVPPYESMATGLTSLHSMNSGNNYISGSLRTRPYQPDLTRGHDVNSGTSSATDSSSSQPVANIYIISNNPIITNSNNNQSNSNDSTRSNSISSNDDDDSIDTSESALTAKRKYKRHAKPDRHAPIKPSSAYIMFSNDSRAELKDRNLSFSELAKIVGDQWKNLNNIDKQNYELMAMRAKDEYLAALERYRQTPQYHCHQEYLNEFKAKQDTANRLIGRARKRAKQTSPRSGSLADSSSNGNSNGNGSSDNGSSDTYGDQESFIRRQQRTLDDQTRLPEQQQQQQDEQLMVELNPQVQVQHYNIDYQSDGMSGENDSSTQLKPISQEQQQPSSDSGYTSQTYYNGNKSPSQRPQWNNRSNQIMRGMLPVEFVHHIPPSSAEQRPESTLKEPSTADIDKDKEDQADRQMSIGNKRRSPRINKSRSTSQT